MACAIARGVSTRQPAGSGAYQRRGCMRGWSDRAISARPTPAQRLIALLPKVRTPTKPVKWPASRRGAGVVQPLCSTGRQPRGAGVVPRGCPSRFNAELRPPVSRCTRPFPVGCGLTCRRSLVRVQVRPCTPVRAPNANAVCERFLRGVRAECLDHVLVLGATHLRSTLRSYCA